MNRQRGMTMVELMVSMAIVMLIIGTATMAYLKVLRTYKTQGRLAESYMANLTGLELLRYDIELAGMGLPAGVNGYNYTEAAADAVNYPYNPADLNDSANNINGNNNVPRAFAHINNNPPAANYSASDVLSIKSCAVSYDATNVASKKWSILTRPNPNGTNNNPAVKQWNDPTMDFVANDRFIMLDSTGVLQKNNGGPYYTFIDAGPNSYYTNSSSIPPPDNMHVFYIYGLDTGNAHSMPFNRVDYYLAPPPNGVNPSSCAPNTLTLYRSTIVQSNGTLKSIPLVDCVRDFQVAFGLDTSAGAQPLQWKNALVRADSTPMTAADIQNQLREVRVFLLYSEGGGNVSKAPEFQFSGTLNIGDQQIAASLDSADYAATGTNFLQVSPAGSPLAGNPQLNTFIPTGQQLNYRWKMVEIAVKPNNLLSLQPGTLR